MSFTRFSSAEKPSLRFQILLYRRYNVSSDYDNSDYFLQLKAEIFCPFQDFQGPQPKFKDFLGPGIFF